MHYRNFRLITITFVLTIIALTSCTKKLSNGEKQILRWDIPLEMYEDKLNTLLTSYVQEVCVKSVELYCDDAQREMNRLSSSPLGLFMMLSVEDISMSSGKKTLSQQLDNYRTNCLNQLNRVSDDFIPDYTNLVVSSTTADNWHDFVSEHPVLSLRDNADIDKDGNLDLGVLSGLDGVPATVDVQDYDYLAGITDNEETLTKPSISTSQDLFGKIAEPKNVDIIYLITAFNKWATMLAKNIPIPVYAWYDKELECWEVGFDNEQAIHVKFKKVNGVLHYQYKEDAEYDINHLQETL